VVEFVVVWWFCPETKGTTLEDVVIVIEGGKAVVSLVNPVAGALKEGKEEGIVEHVEKVG